MNRIAQVVDLEMLFGLLLLFQHRRRGRSVSWTRHDVGNAVLQSHQLR